MTYHFFACLTSISADNLSAHSLGGFQRHFNAGRICRYCMCNWDEMGKSFTESGFTIRNKAVHEYHLDALSVNEDNGPVYGVLHRCPLLDVSGFDLTTALVPDIMHDLIEGTIQNLILKLVQMAVREKKVSLALLNSRLEEACQHVRDRPNLFTNRITSTSGVVVGSAAQKWQLYLIMPQILGQYMDEGNDAWLCYLLLREVTDLVFAPVIERSCLTFLEDLIAQFLTHYVSVFGVGQLTPKHHYMIHYPRLISLYGPLRHLWCMRFEAKHQYFKSVISSLGNYINVTSTMANRHQKRQCWEFTDNDVLHCEPFSVTRTKVWQMSHLPVDLRSAVSHRLETQVNLNEMITSTMKLSYDHITYIVGGCMLLSTVEAEDIPLYLHIKHIILFRGSWLLCGRLCFCHQFNKHLHAYSVNVDDGWAVVYPGEEIDYSMHDMFILDRCCYVNAKYHVPCIPN